MMTLTKKPLLRLSLRTKSKKFNYKSLALKFSNNHFKEIYTEEKDILLSPNELRFNGFLGFGIDINLVKLFYGKPNYTYSNPKNTDTVTLIYKMRVKHLKSRCMLVFHKSKLVVFNYVFLGIDRDDKKFLLKYFNKKYTQNPNTKNYKIIDSNNNSFITHKGKSSITFNFFSRNKEFIQIFEEEKKTTIPCKTTINLQMNY